MVDLSAQGCTALVEMGDGTKVSIAPEDFSDEGNPFTIDPGRVAKTMVDLNGKPFKVSKPVPFRLSLSLLPTSRPFAALHEILVKSRGDAVPVSRLTWQSGGAAGSLQQFFTEGWLVSGPMGVGASREGRKKGGLFELEFWDVYEDEA